MSFNIFTRRRCGVVVARQTKLEPKMRKTRAMRVTSDRERERETQSEWERDREREKEGER